MGTRVTIGDVAGKAGVSIATVSRTLNNIGVVREATRQRVLKAVEELGYSPNVHATSLAKGHSNVIGLVVPDITNPLFNEAAKTVGEAARARGMHLIVTNTFFDPDTAQDCISELIESKVAGIVLFTSVLDLSVIEEAARERIPFCLLDLDLTQEYISSILIDFRNSTVQILEHLVSLGHRRIAYANVRGPLKLTPERNKTFKDCCEIYSSYLDKHWVLSEEYSVAGGKKVIEKLFDEPKGLEPPTAIWLSADVMAFGAMRELRRRGLAVPDDVSIIGWGDTLLSRWSEPVLTTVAFDQEEVGRLAVSAIEHLLQARMKQGLSYTVNSQLVIRDSTGPVRS